MKKIILAFIASGLGMASWAQTDSTTSKDKADTIKIGGVIIIRKDGQTDPAGKTVVISNKKKSNSKVSTNWWIVDIGFTNYND